MTRELVLTVRPEDCRVDFFRAGGLGEQKQHKTPSAARVLQRVVARSLDNDPEWVRYPRLTTRDGASTGMVVAPSTSH